jgi:hypothetical protein
MKYWIDLFTGTTWDEFRKAGSRISGFRARMRNVANQVRPGDIFLCYLTGVMQWVGALEVLRGPIEDKTPIWTEQDFPVRFEVRPLVQLAPEFGIAMADLEGKVSFFQGPSDRGKFKGFVRKSPAPFSVAADGDLILRLLQRKEHEPGDPKELDPRKLARKPLYTVEMRRGKKKIHAEVSVPESEPDEPVEAESREKQDGEVVVASTTRHTEMQYHLAKLGADMGLDVWVAKNDRSRMFNGVALGSMPRMIEELPTQFNAATTRTIELIDVLWLKGNSIVAAFEVEATSAIYSGLLRMSDLLALQPNLDIRLFLVAPDERRKKVETEILRPTFFLRDKPLAKICGFLPFSTLMEKVLGIHHLGIAGSLRPEFLEHAAEFFTASESD